VDEAALQTRGAALSAAAAALDAELEQAVVDDRVALTLRACAHGGSVALSGFCAAVDRSKDVDDAPALALLEALHDEEAAMRATRAAAWAMTAQRVASAWPMTFYEVLEVVRGAMPLGAASFEHMQALGALTACANTTADPDIRDGQRMQFSRESLEHVIGAATRTRPARRDMMSAIPPWTGCFIRGIKACDEHLRGLEARHADTGATDPAGCAGPPRP
jgi:hypothetical protein